MKAAGKQSAQGRRHCLADWLALHELDSVACRRILEAAQLEATRKPAPQEMLGYYKAPDLEGAWQITIDAMRAFFPAQESLIHDVYANSSKVIVEQPDDSRKALTIDNGETAYPTMLLSYRGQPFDIITMAHEFGHALQITASHGKFVTPVVREVCAFLAEGALLTHTLQQQPKQFPHLSQVWLGDNLKYFGPQRDRLQAALSRPEVTYQYSWNYPVARFLSLLIPNRCSREWVWGVFAGETSLGDVLRELSLP